MVITACRISSGRRNPALNVARLASLYAWTEVNLWQAQDFLEIPKKKVMHVNSLVSPSKTVYISENSSEPNSFNQTIFLLVDMFSGRHGQWAGIVSVACAVANNPIFLFMGK